MQLSDKDEAVGAQGVPLTPGRSIAVDKALHVYGTPFFIEGELPIESEQSKTPFRRLMIAQDTGSAIVGPARADLYFGAGAEAGKVAGRLRHNARFVMLVPKSLDPAARGPQDAGARRSAVGENRKAVPANRSVEGSVQGTEGRCEATGGYRGHEHSTVAPPATAPAAGPSQTSAIQAAAAKPVPLPEPRPDHRSRSRQNPTSVTSAAIATSDETPDVEFDPRIAGAAAAQARTERRGTRVVGKRRQAGQAAAQATPC